MRAIAFCEREPDLLRDPGPAPRRRIGQDHDVVRARLEDAAHEPVGRARAQHHDRPVGVLPHRAVDEVEGAVGVAGADDHEQVRGVRQRVPGLLQLVDEPHDLQLGGGRQPGRRLVAFRGVERHDGSDRLCHQPPFLNSLFTVIGESPKSSRSSVTSDGFVCSAPAFGRSTIQTLPNSEENAKSHASSSGRPEHDALGAGRSAERARLRLVGRLQDERRSA